MGTYLSTDAFKAQANDYDLTPYTDVQLLDILTRASGHADAIMRRSLLLQEKIVRYEGDGTNRLELHESPLAYIKRIEVVVTGQSGTAVPLDQVLIDFRSGDIREYTPLLLVGVGFFDRFPRGIPVDVTMGVGYGMTYAEPVWTSADGDGSLPAGTYNVAVSTATMWGETTATVRQVTTAGGKIILSVKSVLGAYRYRAYLSDAANNTTLSAAVEANATNATLSVAGTIAVGDSLLVGSETDNAEIVTVTAVNGTTITAPFVNAHAQGESVIEAPTLVAVSQFSASGADGRTIDLSSLSAQDSLWPDALPLTNTASPAVPMPIVEATRQLALSMLYEQNNLANRGVFQQKSGHKELSWKSTEGMSGKGVPLMVQTATELLAPFALCGIF